MLVRPGAHCAPRERLMFVENTSGHRILSNQLFVRTTSGMSGLSRIHRFRWKTPTSGFLSTPPRVLWPCTPHRTGRGIWQRKNCWWSSLLWSEYLTLHMLPPSLEMHFSRKRATILCQAYVISICTPLLVCLRCSKTTKRAKAFKFCPCKNIFYM